MSSRRGFLQNFLAGILLLLHEPFRIGDLITINGLEGTVDDIQTRATIITTPDGHKVVIPNGVLFTNPVVVKTISSAEAIPYAATPAPTVPAANTTTD